MVSSLSSSYPPAKRDPKAAHMDSLQSTSLSAKHTAHVLCALWYACPHPSGNPSGLLSLIPSEHSHFIHPAESLWLFGGKGGGFICNHVQKRSAVWSGTLLWQTSSSSSYSGSGQSFKRDMSCPWTNKEQKLRERLFSGEHGVCYSDLKKIPQSQKWWSPSFSSSFRPVSHPAVRQQLWHPGAFVLSDIFCFVRMSLVYQDYIKHFIS